MLLIYCLSYRKLIALTGMTNFGEYVNVEGALVVITCWETYYKKLENILIALYRCCLSRVLIVESVTLINFTLC